MTAIPAGAPRVASHRAQRALDVGLGSLLLAAVLPVLLLLLLAVRLSGPGPVIYRQERVGRAGRPFELWKLRTMHDGADRHRAELEGHDDGAGPLFKLVDDPRVTPVGRLLRRCSLDELPQLVQVVRGDMSLVGPRPALPREVAVYPEHVRRRLDVRPGLTGLWQVSGRSDLSWHQSVHLDLQYVEHRDVAMDLVILARTVPAVLSRRGAY